MGIKNLKEAKNDELQRKKLIISIIKLSLLLLLVVGIPLYIYINYKETLQTFKSIEDVVALLQKYEGQSMAIYFGLQVMQIVISFIPGQIFQMAASYLYGFLPAYILALSGAAVGTAISFWLAKLLGRDFLHVLFGEDKMKYYVEKLNSKRAYTIVFLVYLIPGIPKDMVSYAAGISEMKFKPFLLLSLIGRQPGMIGCLIMGSFLEQKNYTAVIIIAVIAGVCLLLCLIFRKKLQAFLDKAYEKIL